MTQNKKYWNEEMETLSPEMFSSIHEERLMKQLDYVWKNSVLYQEKYRAAGIDRSIILFVYSHVKE